MSSLLFCFWTPINIKARRLTLLFTLIITSSSLLGAEEEFRPSYFRIADFGPHFRFRPPWHFALSWEFALLGFHLGTRVSGISSGYFLLGLRVWQRSIESLVIFVKALHCTYWIYIEKFAGFSSPWGFPRVNRCLVFLSLWSCYAIGYLWNA